jgi:HSP20 family protein
MCMLMWTRFDPFRQMEQMLRPVASPAAGTPMDVYRRGEELRIDIDMPGVDPDSVDLTLERDVLHVTARRTLSFEDDDRILLQERPAGEFRRQLLLGQGFDHDRVEASYRDGVLSIRLPVAEAAKPHRIAIGRGGKGHKAVEAEAGADREAAAVPA